MIRYENKGKCKHQTKNSQNFLTLNLYKKIITKN